VIGVRINLAIGPIPRRKYHAISTTLGIRLGSCTRRDLGTGYRRNIWERLKLPLVSPGHAGEER
jgi:hypothetical protein